MQGWHALYYPFSRCLDVAVLKQLLLQFDSITFLDPVDDDEWRNHLFKNIENEHGGYLGYRDLGQAMPWLRSTGAIRVESPDRVESLQSDLTTYSTLSDLLDEDWISAANPSAYNLPTQKFNDQPCWNVFKPKLPTGVIDALFREERFRRHLLECGGDDFAWHLSYAAGSAVGINVHLAAADELSLAPVTDSRLHHDLMLWKLRRNASQAVTSAAIDRVTGALATRAIFKVIDTILPAKQLELLSLQDILHFRDETAPLREEFRREVAGIVAAQGVPSEATGGEKIVAEVTRHLIDSARRYGNEVAFAKNKLWPKLIEGALTPTAMVTSVFGLAASYITSSGYVLAASAAAYALGPAKSLTEWRAEKQRIEGAEGSAVAYISQVHSLGR